MCSVESTRLACGLEEACGDKLKSASRFPEHSTFFDDVMNSDRSHPVIQRARSALW